MTAERCYRRTAIHRALRGVAAGILPAVGGSLSEPQHKKSCLRFARLGGQDARAPGTPTGSMCARSGSDFNSFATRPRPGIFYSPALLTVPAPVPTLRAVEDRRFETPSFNWVARGCARHAMRCPRVRPCQPAAGRGQFFRRPDGARSRPRPDFSLRLRQQPRARL